MTSEVKPETRSLYLGLGSNMGDRSAYLREGIAFLAAFPGLAWRATSTVYETEPYGPIAQAPFLNLALAFETSLLPEQVLDACLAAEHAAGRVRTVRWGPRTLDVDILLMGETAYRTDRLTIPHPGLCERPFVLIPLAELAPSTVVAGQTLQARASACPREGLRALSSW